MNVRVSGRRGLWRRIRLRILRVRIWRVARISYLRLWRLRMLLFSAQHELCSNLGVQILVVIETDVVAGRAIENPQGDLADRLSAGVELDHSLDTFNDQLL